MTGPGRSLAYTATVPATYDHIGLQYEEYANTATMKIAERYVFLELVGALDGQSVLDLACGHGYYTRLLEGLGAGEVVGVDISEEMIRLARELEAAEPLGIHYRVADGADVPDLEPVDLVTAVWLLNYAGSRTKLRDLVSGVHDRLKPGGRFVGVTINPDYDLGRSNMTRYGVEVLSENRDTDPPQIVGRFLTDPPSEPVVVDRFDRETLEAAFREAGFSALEWKPYWLSDDLIAEYGEAYWHDLVTNGLPIAFVARR